MWLLYSDIWKTSKPPTTRLAGNAPARKRYHKRSALSTATFARILRRIELIGHRVDHSNSRVAVIQRPLNALQIVKFPHQIDGIHLPDAVRRDILRKPERLGSSLDIRPNSLPRSMLRRTLWTLKNPDFPRITHHFSRQPLRKVHTPALSCLLLAYPELQAWCLPCLRCLRRRSVVLAGRGVSRRRALVLAWGGRRAAPCPLLVRRSRGAKIDSAQRQNVTDSQAGMQTDAHDERICRCQSRQNVPNLPVEQVFRSHFLPPLARIFPGQLSDAQARRSPARRTSRRRLTILKKSNVKLSFQLREPIHKLRQPLHKRTHCDTLRERVACILAQLHQHAKRVNLRFHSCPCSPDVSHILHHFHPLPVQLRMPRPAPEMCTRSPSPPILDS